MLNVNDDMEELLRRAAENYPLKTGTGNFDQVLGGMRAANEAEAVPVKKEGRDKLLWLLLLLPLGIVCNRYVYPGTEQAHPSDISKAVNKATGEGTTKNAATRKNLTKEGKLDSPPIQKHLLIENNKGVKQAIEATEEAEENRRRGGLFHSNRKAIIAWRRASANNSKQQEMIGGEPEVWMASKEATSSRGESDGLKTPTLISGETKVVDDNHAEALPELPLNSSPQALPAEEDKEAPQVKQQDLPATNSVPVSVIPFKKRTSYKSNTRRFYFGTVLGPDMSTVKGDRISKVGFSGGLLAGYQVNKKVAIETGLLWNKKFYNSDGKYFDTKKSGTPAYIRILELDGYCNMFEIPVGIKYNFLQNRKSGWFAVVGASSYIMKEESYNYNYLRYGQVNTRSADYHSSSTNWFSVLNVSAGYFLKVGKTTMLRFEPYFKIPVSGVGIGGLPITSTGLYAGFFKSVF